MGFFAAKILTAFVLPPGVNILVGLAGLVCLLAWRRVAWMLIAIALGSLYLLSVPAVARALQESVEIHPPWSADPDNLGDLGAIVVLGGGRRTNAYEYGGETVSAATLMRVRYGVRLHRLTGLSLLFTGGSVYDDGPSEAELMRRTVEQDYGVSVFWREERARNTAENALYSEKILAQAGIYSVILVTHATHMARAVEAFEAVGLKVQPAPLGFSSSPAQGFWIRDWLPGTGALNASRAALHERVGTQWYRLRRSMDTWF